LRAYTLWPFFHIIAAAGLWLLVKSVYDLFPRRLNRKLAGIIKGALYGLCVLPFLAFFGFFLSKYYFYYPKQPLNYLYYQYGIKEVMDFVNAHDKQLKEVYFGANINQPFIYVLFYSRFDPVKYQAIKKDGSMIYFGYVSHFDKYYFLDNVTTPVAKPKTIYIMDNNEPVAGTQLLQTVLNPSGEVQFQIWGDPEILQ
jgi:hypothetical protein